MVTTSKMEEKNIIKSEQYKTGKLALIIIILGLIITLIWTIAIISDGYNDYIETDPHHHDKWCFRYGCETYDYDSALECGFGKYLKSYTKYFTFIPLFSFAIISALIYFGLNSYSLTITDKRIYGKTWFGKRVDLPVDSISATSSIALFKGVSVATSSGKISFLLIKNSDEVYKELNNLIINRQNKKEESKPIEIIKETQNLSNADELKKYKELLDMGIITQEEFDAKKKQLLGL